MREERSGAAKTIMVFKMREERSKAEKRLMVFAII